MPFRSNLDMRHIEGTERYSLLADLLYVTWKVRQHTIPKGFSSDGHSIPKLLRSFAGSPFATKFPKSAWLHDNLLETLVAAGLMTQFEAASLYSEALDDEGATTFQRKRNWLGVRIGDFWHNLKRKFWRKDV